MRGLARAAGLGEEAAETAWDPDRISAPRSVCEGALGTGVHAATDHRHKRGGALRRCSTEARPCRGRSTLCSPNGKTPAAWGGISFVRRHCFCYKPATNITSRVIGNHWGAP